MEMTSPNRFRKATVIPLAHISWEVRLDRPFQVAESLSFENIEGFLKPELFSLWRDWVSQRDRENLAGARFGLLHRFESGGHLGREEADSSDLAFKTFLCLRLIKPTKSNFEPIQLKFLDGGEIEVFSLTHPSTIWPNVPEAESINSIALDDIAKLQALLPAFLALATHGPENIRRAVRFFNSGYTEVRDPTIQIIVWFMGIEALFADEEAALSHSQLMERIDSAVGLKTDIYNESAMREYIGNSPFLVGNLVEDLVTLRNRFVHGQWIPPQWKSRSGRNSLGGEPIYYADVLREAASFILRKGILRHLEERTAVPFP